MAVKTITVTESAYYAVNRLKEKNESFSELFLRIAKRKPLSSFFGVLSKEAGEELSRNIRKSREMRRPLDEARRKKILQALLE